jgi:biopolymer transport protein ExbD/biopolymer transport protein TolR
MAAKKKENEVKTKAPPPINDINVTPMVDVMLVLLIIFMVITPMLSKGHSIEKVKARNPIPMQAADKSDAVLVTVARDGKVYLGTNEVNPDDLAPKVKDMLSNRLDKECFIAADTRARYERVVDVVDNLRAAGVDQIGLITEQLVDKNAKRPATSVAGAPAGM